jgi:hypothetical protein
MYTDLRLLCAKLCLKLLAVLAVFRVAVTPVFSRTTIIAICWYAATLSWRCFENRGSAEVAEVTVLDMYL